MAENGYISIHALRGEGDEKPKKEFDGDWHFNPRPPWGGRLFANIGNVKVGTYFNPRPPWGGRPLDVQSRFKS